MHTDVMRGCNAPGGVVLANAKATIMRARTPGRSPSFVALASGLAKTTAPAPKSARRGGGPPAQAIICGGMTPTFCILHSAFLILHC